jgi:hypothetical protein
LPQKTNFPFCVYYHKLPTWQFVVLFNHKGLSLFYFFKLCYVMSFMVEKDKLV